MQNTELFTKFSKLRWLLHRLHLQNHTEHGPWADTSRGQGRVLAMLKIQPEISSKDLSYLLGIRQQSLNELLNKLEKNEYITRIPSEVDKRVMLIKLTEKGENEKQVATDYEDIFNCLNEKEQATLGEYIDRLVAALKAHLGTVEEDDDMSNWMQAMRSRIGDEQFEHLMSMRMGGLSRFHGGKDSNEMFGRKGFSKFFGKNFDEENDNGKCRGRFGFGKRPKCPNDLNND